MDFWKNNKININLCKLLYLYIYIIISDYNCRLILYKHSVTFNFYQLNLLVLSCCISETAINIIYLQCYK